MWQFSCFQLKFSMFSDDHKSVGWTVCPLGLCEPAAPIFVISKSLTVGYWHWHTTTTNLISLDPVNQVTLSHGVHSTEWLYLKWRVLCNDMQEVFSALLYTLAFRGGNVVRNFANLRELLVLKTYFVLISSIFHPSVFFIFPQLLHSKNNNVLLTFTSITYWKWYPELLKLSDHSWIAALVTWLSYDMHPCWNIHLSISAIFGVTFLLTIIMSFYELTYDYHKHRMLFN